MPWSKQSYDEIDRRNRLNDIMLQEFKSLFMKELDKYSITIFTIQYSNGFVTYYLHLPENNEIIHAFLHFKMNYKFTKTDSPVGKYKLYFEAGDSSYVPSPEDI